MKRGTDDENKMPLVKPRLKTLEEDTFRSGRGFSLGEIKEARISPYDMKVVHLPLDRRRKTTHDANVKKLRELLGKSVKESGVQKSKPKEKAKAVTKKHVGEKKGKGKK